MIMFWNMFFELTLSSKSKVNDTLCFFSTPKLVHLELVPLELVPAELVSNARDMSHWVHFVLVLKKLETRARVAMVFVSTSG